MPHYSKSNLVRELALLLLASPLLISCGEQITTVIANHTTGGNTATPNNVPNVYNDTSLCPAGLSSLCGTLPNLPVFNVKNYGAIGNCIADDTVAIRKALAAAQTAKGGIVYLPKGCYAVQRQSTDPLNSGYGNTPLQSGPIFTINSSNITIIGDGPGQTTLS